VISNTAKFTEDAKPERVRRSETNCKGSEDVRASGASGKKGSGSKKADTVHQTNFTTVWTR